MIVDDHAAFRQEVKAQLHTAGAACVECEDGPAAVEQYPTVRPALVLKDIAAFAQPNPGTTLEPP